MSENSFSAAYKKLYDTHIQQLDRKSQYDAKHTAALMRAWDLQMQCFLKDDTECVHQYDQLFIEHNRVSREKLLNGRKCLVECDKDGSGPPDINRVVDSEGLYKSKKYFECMTPCIEKIIWYTSSELKVLDKTIQVVSGFLKKE